jgi:LAO/AO transport system kinase
LQGIKRGVMELADLVLVTKADGRFVAAARHAAADYKSALSLIRPKAPFWRPEVLLVSAREGRGIDEAWQVLARHRAGLAAEGGLERRRAEQARRWLWSEIEHGLRESFATHRRVARLLPAIEAEVAAARLSPAEAARRLLAAYRGEG